MMSGQHFNNETFKLAIGSMQFAIFFFMTQFLPSGHCKLPTSYFPVILNLHDNNRLKR